MFLFVVIPAALSRAKNSSAAKTATPVSLVASP